MGPEVDAVLVVLARGTDVQLKERVNAILLLADRHSPAAIPVLRQILLSEGDDDVRAATVLALQRLGPDDEEATDLIRSAVGDPAALVRLNALQALGVGDVDIVRGVLEHEPAPAVRQIARQLVVVDEARGAPLARDRRGALRTSGTTSDAQIVFRPARVDSVVGIGYGDLRVELPNAPDVPLTALAQVVARVVPAFFSPDHSKVVDEADGDIRVVDLASQAVRTVGEGIAPRLVPFSDDFVFVRERSREHAPQADSTVLEYDVIRAGFAGKSTPVVLGTLKAVARMDRHGNASPVRWMIVSDTPGGYLLHGDGVEPFVLYAQAGAAAPPQPSYWWAHP
jgi:hypothetical protein